MLREKRINRINSHPRLHRENAKGKNEKREKEIPRQPAVETAGYSRLPL